MCLLDCVIGPASDPVEKVDRGPLHEPVIMSNAFHVWDSDDIIIHLPEVDESPQLSPLLMAAMPYIPHFFPPHGSHSSPALLSGNPNSGSSANTPQEV